MVFIIVVLACVGAALGAGAIELFGRSLDPTGTTPNKSLEKFIATMVRVKGAVQSRKSLRSRTPPDAICPVGKPGSQG